MCVYIYIYIYIYICQKVSTSQQIFINYSLCVGTVLGVIYEMVRKTTFLPQGGSILMAEHKQ